MHKGLKNRVSTILPNFINFHFFQKQWNAADIPVLLAQVTNGKGSIEFNGCTE
jgi:hypothetical protein